MISRELNLRVHILHRLDPACFLSSTDLKAHSKIAHSEMINFLMDQIVIGLDVYSKYILCGYPCSSEQCLVLKTS